MIKLAACLCFKNSAAYLAEWLAYHHALGVEHFFLYDNGSTDDYLRVIEPFAKRGLITLTRWPGKAQQEFIYQNCLIQARDRVEWVAFLDDDEFLNPIIDPDIPTALKRFEAHAGVAVSWFLFGSSGHERRPQGLVIENFTGRATAPDKHVKCVVRPDRVKGPLYIGHVFVCEPGFTVVDEHGRTVSECPHGFASGDILRVNHYATKSIEEVRERRSQPRADNGQISEHSLAMWIQWAREWNETKDETILRFVPAVRRELGEAPVLF
ncbi:MAG TPA: glycosyltransferase family 92 protein [Opitutaceae bacterium]|nr:glycosyltransferase family 92 protein [Opitutaceae bacterium]